MSNPAILLAAKVGVFFGTLFSKEFFAGFFLKSHFCILFSRAFSIKRFLLAFFLKKLRMDATACLICLEKFTEDEAFIPELECECAFFVHWRCWEQWCGACLYCRVYDEEPVEEPVEENINQEIMQNGYNLFSNLLFLILAILIPYIFYR